MTARNPTLILSFTLLVVMLGYSMVLPVIPFMISELGMGGRELGWMMSTYALMQFLCAPLWGVLSDRVGRKPVLTVGVLGYAISMLMFGLSSTFLMLFIARTLSGILSSATMPTSLAYIGDNSPQKERGSRMGKLGATMGLGAILGPLLGGFLSSDALAIPFFVGAGLAFLAALLVILILPESHPTAVQAPDTGPEGNSRLLKNVFSTARATFLSPVGILLLLIFIMSFGMANFQGIIGLYTVDKFNFSTKQVGTIWMVMGAMLILVQGLLTGRLTQKFGEAALIRTGLAGAALGLIGISQAVNYVTLLLALVFFTLGLALIGPSLNAHISGLAGENQGTVMGLNSAATSLGKVAGPLWAGYVFDVNIEFPLLSGAAALVVGLLVSLVGIKGKNQTGYPELGDQKGS
jgi:MFS transporter, DHA1 family, multidrug resistance protein